MGTTGIAIAKIDTPKLINLLNQAYASEWLAFYQYYIGATVLRGPMKDAAVKELMDHANDEYGHAKTVADRIIQLGGTPLLTPNEWEVMTPCSFAAPTDAYTLPILDQNIVGEQCAIKFYQDILDYVRGRDDVTFQIIVDILDKEVEHEEDLQRFKEDLTLMFTRGLS